MKNPLTIFQAALIAASLALPATAGESQAASETRLIQIVLVEATTSGGLDISTLPENVRPAIDDIRRFLPFKGFHLLDTTLLRSNGRGQALMRGPGQTEYLVAFMFRGGASVEKLMIDELIVEDRTFQPPPAAPTGRSGLAEAPAPRAPSSVLRTSFAAEPGKTVVVGSSRLDGGDKALIVLFTALP